MGLLMEKLLNQNLKAEMSDHLGADRFDERLFSRRPHWRISNGFDEVALPVDQDDVKELDTSFSEALLHKKSLLHKTSLLHE